MATGLYPNIEVIERFQASVSAANLAQPFVAPCDLDVVGLLASLGTAPGASTMTINVNVSPTSQLGLSASPSAYNMWTAANVPSVVNTATKSYTTQATTTVIENVPYALNYPLPGPSGAKGFVTAQSTTQTTQTPVVAPPTMIEYGLTPGNLVAPDNTYTDLNGFILSAALIHAGDVCTFVVGGTVGSAANLAISLYCLKR